jgi:hypothetical protein
MIIMAQSLLLLFSLPFKDRITVQDTARNVPDHDKIQDQFSTVRLTSIDY